MSSPGTAAAVIARLPQSDLLSPRELAAALNIADARAILAAIRAGELSAVRVNKKIYRIARAEAVRWLTSIESY